MKRLIVSLMATGLLSFLSLGLTGCGGGEPAVDDEIDAGGAMEGEPVVIEEEEVDVIEPAGGAMEGEGAEVEAPPVSVEPPAEEPAAEAPVEETPAEPGTDETP